MIVSSHVNTLWLFCPSQIVYINQYKDTDSKSKFFLPLTVLVNTIYIEQTMYRCKNNPCKKRKIGICMTR